MFPFKDVAAVEHIDTPLSNEMIDALDLWYKMYTDSPPWLSPRSEEHTSELQSR